MTRIYIGMDIDAELYEWTKGEALRLGIQPERLIESYVSEIRNDVLMHDGTMPLDRLPMAGSA
jgi:hypothetical protein